ncbi:ester cyclase [Streptomyces sp. NPDC020681]|uniref:ester cyclase n=1 Tax=Streptomyces sp. NPDC020681 TaxID=3365083 RepID=UPI00378A5CE0
MEKANEQSLAADAAWMADLALRWRTAWNSHDAGKVLDLMTDDITVRDDVWPVPMHGHVEVRTWIEQLWTAFPNLEFEVLGAYARIDSSGGALHWRARGTNSGPYEPLGLIATGLSIDLDGADFHLYRDGLISYNRATFNGASLLGQLGLLD